MSGNEPTLEAEIVEIDGVAVEHKPVREESGKGAPWARWGSWQSQVKRFDARWWPLWAVLGFVALVLLVSIGMVALVLYVSWRIVTGILSAVFSMFLPSSAQMQRR